jgi:hypothetical protein
MTTVAATGVVDGMVVAELLQHADSSRHVSNSILAHDAIDPSVC